MEKSSALSRYLQRHIEAGLPRPAAGAGPWQHVIVLPAYNESPDLPERLARFTPALHSALIILVLNRPDSCLNTEINEPLRQAITDRETLPADTNIYPLNNRLDLLLFDLERDRGPTAKKEGVGLARKAGCDLALLLHGEGRIVSDWICCTDADASLPQSYFSLLEDVPPDAAAATFPFMHSVGDQRQYHEATSMYELRLHHYVLGLEYASSPYAYHTLGSAMAIRGEHYARVRGFPRRAGGEDFYLLNKLAKTGSIERLHGECITLESRHSDRVPFGTGPAVKNIMEAGASQGQKLFYHPLCFEALCSWLATIPQLFDEEMAALPGLLAANNMPGELVSVVESVLLGLGLEDAWLHCRQQGKTPAQFNRQFHQWFDGFRTLKFIHHLRDEQLPMQSLEEVLLLSPKLWPRQADNPDINSMVTAVHRHWGWTGPRC